MRIESLRIERYGAFEEKTLDFAPTAPLTLVYGPNEAGKSTSLAAVKDFLFGIPERTPKTVLYGAEGLRLTASLRLSDGGLLTLRRRKGRGRTLTDSNGNPVEEAQLARLLGGIAKDRFETFFALDHHGLRSGGADLLTAEGEIGRLIIEAGGGLRPLVRRLERLEAEIDGLFAPRRSTERAFYRALDAFTAADRDVKAGVLSPSQYERLRLGVETAERHRDEVRDRKAMAAKGLSKAQRNGRVATPLRQLDETRAALASMCNLPSLPDEFHELVDAAKARLAQTRESAALARGRAEGLTTRLAELNIDPGWSAAEVEILDLAQKRAVLAKQREDRPNRIKELTEAEQKLIELRRRLGAGPEDDLVGRLPPRADVARVSTLASEAQRREPQLDAAAARLKELQRELSKLQQRIADTQATARCQPLGVTAAEIASLPSSAQAADLRRRQAQAALTRAKDGAIALGFEDLDSLARTPFPTAQRMTEELRVLEELEAQLRTESKVAADAEAEEALQLIEAERLSQGGAPATNELVRAAREARGQALEPLREAYRAGHWDTPADARAREVDKADRAIATADDLVDRRAAEAQRAAEHAQALRLREAAAARNRAARSEIERLTALVAARTEALATAFPIAAKLYPEPRALEDAARRREDTLAAAKEANAELGHVQAAESLLSGPLELLAHVEQTAAIHPKAGATLAERVRAALVAIAAHEEAYADFKRDVAKLEKDRLELQGAEERLDELKTSEIEWKSAWVVALPKLGLDPKMSLDDAAAGAMEWAAAEGVLTTLTATRRRLARMDEDEAAVIRRADALGQRLGLQLPQDALAKVELLQRRWSEHQAKMTKHEALTEELKQHQQDAIDSEAAAEKAAAVFADLCSQAGVPADDETALAKLRAGHLERRRLRATEQQLLQTLAAAGGGISEAALRTEWQGADPDSLKAEETKLAGDLEALEAVHTQAIEAAVKAKSEFDEALDEKGFSAALAAREAAIADLHLVAERYVPLALARDLLKEAIAKVRAQQQDPLIARAGALMSVLTRGAFSGVAADIDDSGQPVVVGLDQSGRSVPVGLMSDGARDQLYLSFRLAGLESYCAGAEPLPFVADDLLVHFDDARTAAALEVLANFGLTTQVLLFTHHESVRKAVEPLVAAGRAGVLDLG